MTNKKLWGGYFKNYEKRPIVNATKEELDNFEKVIRDNPNFKGHKTAGLMRPIIQRGLTDFQINEMFIKEVNSIRRKN